MIMITPSHSSSISILCCVFLCYNFFYLLLLLLLLLYYSVQTLLSSRLLSKSLKIKIYKTIIMPVVLYGSETWSLTLRQECRLRVFENRNLRRISWPKIGANEDRRRLHNEELHSLYRSPNIARMIIIQNIKMACIQNGRRQECFQNFNR